MKRFTAIIVIAAFISSAAACAQAAGLEYLLKDKKPVKVFLGDFSNQTGKAEVSAENFKAAFKDALLNRKAVKFDVVDSAKSSDVQISCIIKKHTYLESDPINSLAGPSALVLDAVTTENYADMEAEFTITDTATGKVAWKEVLSAYVEKTMTPGQSLPLVYDKLSRVFLWKSFGKPR